MTRKYTGLYSVILLLCAICASIVYYATDSWKPDHGQLEHSGFTPPPLYPEPGAAEINAMDRLRPIMAKLSTPVTARYAPADLRLLGFVPYPSTAHRTGKTRRTTKEDQPAYDLSLIFSSGTNRFCIMNERFYKEGDILPDGNQIVSIRKRKVLLDKNGLNSWILMDMQQKQSVR